VHLDDCLCGYAACTAVLVAGAKARQFTEVALCRGPPLTEDFTQSYRDGKPLPVSHLPVRLLGLVGSSLDAMALIQGMFFDGEEREQQGRVDDVADQIRERHGPGALRHATGRILAGTQPVLERHGS
jgi:hypothetical protein